MCTPGGQEQHGTRWNVPVIMHLALRALRRVHFEHQPLTLGHTGSTPLERIPFLNRGRGVEIALETAVGTAFSQEFSTSKLSNGWVIPELDKCRRFWVIDREVKYTLTKTGRSRSIDFVIRRIDPENAEQFVPYGIGPLELKRSSPRVLDLSGREAPDTGSAHGEVAKDIEKLVTFARACSGDGEIECEYLRGEKPPVTPHILVWGTREAINANRTEGDPYRFVNKAFAVAKATVGPIEVEWCPVAWSVENPSMPSSESVTAWLWLAYAEVLY
jgi:hypothetical protein